LGDSPAKIVVIFGAATPHRVPGRANEKTLTFLRAIVNPKPDYARPS
jgi:hypothetical protein